MFAEEVSYSVAFIGGFLSFFSGCVLPLIPAYFTYITGFSIKDMTGDIDIKIRSKVLLSTLAFIFGFSVIFILVGMSATYLGNVITDNNKDLIRIIGGHFVIFFGLHLTGIVKIRLFEYEKRFNMVQKRVSILGTFFIGMAFAAGWTPCIGPVLGSITIMAMERQDIQHSILLLSLYSFGFAIPFLLISIFINFILVFIKKASRFIPYVNIASGLLLIAIGIMLILDRLSFISL
ncbi:MAG: cytochrome c biogenesis protein CcdA [Desulfobacterales bacterium]|nr:cytochrome c biogenesis protein CcdA [Desulfobacterales bacterium]MCP4159540.1 cytochrome c biogenesis protein CcdA [Deltaproteobacteria bacterium]